MKAQKLGLVLGINMAAACLVMQGCKATRPVKPVPPAPNRPVITVTSVAPRTTPVTEPYVAPAQPATPAPVVVDQPAVSRPSSVRTVKTLPPPVPKPPKAPTAKPAAAPAPAPAAATTEYVVKPGDTLFLISKRTNYRQNAIVAANPGLNPDRLRVGQKIKMPGEVAASAVAKAAKPDAKAAAKDKDGKVLPAAAPSPAAANTKASVKTKSGYVPYEGPTKEYVVKSGDSLGKIAGEYGISIRALKALNGLQKDSLRTGQKLKVPTEKQVAAAKKAPGATKKDAAVKEAAAPAKPADEAAKNAAAPAKPAEETAAKPAADNAKPVNAAPAEVATKPADDAKPAETAPAVRTHVVKEGEDLVQIAIGYTISPSVLMDLNDLKASDEIKPGQVLKLPPNAKVNGQ